MGSGAITLSDFAGYTNPDYAGWQRYYVNLDNALNAVNTGQITPEEFERVVYDTTGRYVKPRAAANGRVIAYDFSDKPSFQSNNPLNSNASQVRRGQVRAPLTTGASGGAVTTGKITPPSSVPARAYIANSIASPLVAVGTGITLGKVFDSALYNANPSFWDANGMSSLNPETWNAITYGIDHTDPVTGVAADLLNVIFGLDPDGTTQAYIDEEAFAYMASYMANNGVFEQPVYEVDDTTVPGNVGLVAAPVMWVNVSLTEPLIDRSGNTYYYNPALVNSGTIGERFSTYYAAAEPVTVRLVLYPQGVTTKCFYVIPENQSLATFYIAQLVASSPTFDWLVSRSGLSSATLDGRTVRYSYGASASDVVFNQLSALVEPSAVQTERINSLTEKRAWIVLYGEYIASGGGLPSQPGATVPDPAQMQTPADALAYLPTFFPDLWNNAIDYPVIQPDGTVDNHKYIPINLPIADGNGDTQPTSGDETQQRMPYVPGISPDELAELLQKLLQQPEDNPFSDELEPTPNPGDTGSGTTPSVVIPTGEASALWSIYNPTQAQVDAFGAWLWSPNFVDQIAKIFNNPMESIIGLHKIFATPSTGAAQHIQVGYLDSGVSSAVVTSQYATVDCGTVDVAEEYGSLFDYSPYTEIKLYLPFVGIVPLDPAYVMRSSVNVTYRVDVLTGACLAEVTITRDGDSGGVLYQYAGNAAVTYPISSGSYMGIVAGIAGAVGSVAATLATGGGALPVILGAGGTMAGARTNVQNSGSFGGNAGAMGGKAPYLIISRPQTKVAQDFPHLQGYPTNTRVKIGECSGLIICKEVHGLAANATAEEIDEITELLESGVIV